MLTQSRVAADQHARRLGDRGFDDASSIDSATARVSWILLPIAGRLGTGLPAANGTISSGAVVALQAQERGGAWSLRARLGVPRSGDPEYTDGREWHRVHAGERPGGRPSRRGRRLRRRDRLAPVDERHQHHRPVSPGSFWTGLGQIYVGATDGTLYAFGFDDERRHIQGG